MPTPNEIRELVAFLRENPAESWNPLYDAIEELVNETRQSPFTNSIGMDFTWITPGRFLMGALDSDREAAVYERPRHEVVLSQGYFLGKYAVTRGQFAEFVTATGYQPARDWQKPGFVQSDDHPVVNVCWVDATAFCDWLSQKEGVEYRLPTEAEWECACRAGTTTIRYNGRGALSKIAWFKGNNGTASHPVGQLRPNHWGLYDMLGNVFEWCDDRWRIDYPAEKVIDPVGSETDSYRTFRGGSWCHDHSYCRSSFRLRYEPEYADTTTGFRVARSG